MVSLPAHALDWSATGCFAERFILWPGQFGGCPSLGGGGGARVRHRGRGLKTGVFRRPEVARRRGVVGKPRSRWGPA